MLIYTFINILMSLMLIYTFINILMSLLAPYLQSNRCHQIKGMNV